ncbi:hypothetical protein SC936_00070 [Aggregatibacter actinomycetemcomitans serotype e str. SC936]|nr:hypothetical protein SA3096_08565 [Aggregatibacter actinomycetemcomitans serotype e str. SA3096]KYK82844.1 hypothetical protein SC936_00070 [Aggregatibacter actinomycetemcomitans serotype e str. SC936]
MIFANHFPLFCKEGVGGRFKVRSKIKMFFIFIVGIRVNPVSHKTNENLTALFLFFPAPKGLNYA